MPNKFKRNIVLLICIHLLSYCFSQERNDTVYKRLIKFPVLSADYYHNPNSDCQKITQDAFIKTTAYNTQLSFAIPIKKRKTYLFSSVKYHYNKYEVSSNNTPYISANIHTIRYNLGLIKVLPERWRLSMNFIPNLSTDFNETLGKNDFVYYGVVLAMKRAGLNHEYGFGLAYTSYVSLFESPLIVPIYTLTVKKSRLTTRLIFPSFFLQSYKLNEKIQLGYRIGVDGNFHNVWYTEGLTKLDLNSLSNIKVTAGPYVQRKLIGDIYLNGTIGIVVLNHYNVLDNYRNKELHFFTNSNLYLKLGIVLLK